MLETAASRTPGVHFHGHFDGLENGLLRGWAVCNTARFCPVKIHVIIDQQEVAIITADLHREDVQAALSMPDAEVGFLFTIPAEYFDGEKHTLSLRFDDRSALAFSPDGETTAITFAAVVRQFKRRAENPAAPAHGCAPDHVPHTAA